MASTIPPESVLELDQEDIAARLQSDAYFSGKMAVLLERRGITANDVQIALGVMNPNAPGKAAGTVVIVLMPSMVAKNRESPGPYSQIRYGIQILDWPLIRSQASGGTLVSAEEISDRIREIIHWSNFGRGQALYFDGMDPKAVKPGMVSYIVWFRKENIDQPPVSCASVGISPQTAGAQTVTLVCATAGSMIYYTTDGTYPTPPTTLQGGVASTGQTYTGPFSVAAGTLLRCSALAMGYQLSQAISSFQF